jgi:predicted transcriptional regulator
MCTGFVKEFPFQIYKPKYLLKLIAYIQHQNYEAPLFCYLITKKFLSNFLFSRLDIHNSGVFSCESHYFSSHIIERNMKVSFITPKKTNFLLITQDVFCFMLYISCKYGLKWCRELKKFFFLTNTKHIYPVGAKIIAFRSTVTNIVFSDNRYENKDSFVGEEIRSIKTT